MARRHHRTVPRVATHSVTFANAWLIAQLEQLKSWQIRHVTIVKVRLVVNDLPMRQSATYTSPAGPYEAFADTIGGHLVIELGPGKHSAWLQWKKSAGGLVTSWRNTPSSHDGFASGRSIVVTAQVSRHI